MNIEQYSMYCFDLSYYDEHGKKIEDIMYGVVISPNEMNEMLQTVIIAPLCNGCAITPTTFLIDNETRIKLDQLTTVSKTRIIEYFDKLDNSQIPKVKNVLSEMFVK